MLLAFGGLYHAGGADLLDEVVAHIGQCRIPVQTGIVLHFYDGMLNEFLLVLAEAKFFRKFLLAFDELGGCKAPGNTGPLGVVLDDMTHGMDAPVDRAVRAEILHRRENFLLSRVPQHVHQLGNAFIFGGADGHHRYADGLGHFLHVHAAAVAPKLVHHVQSNNHGDLKGQQLKR